MTVQWARFICLVVCALTAGALTAHAQFGSTEPISLSISPEYPRPFQVVTITPESSLIDLAASTITISVNGQLVLRSSGKESASVAVGGAGQTTTIVVTAVNAGQTYTARATIRPAEVALIVEPQSSTHPFYAGGALVASEGSVRIVAVPDLRTAAGTQIPSEDLVYTWRNGTQILESASGIGKSVLAATAPVRFRDVGISLTVTTRDNSLVAFASVPITPVEPFIRIYENQPLVGPRFERALTGAVPITGDEAAYRAVPFYFRTTPSLTWSVNGTASQTGADITVRPSGSGRGRALLAVEAVSAAPRQTARADLSVLFGTVANGLFGL